MNDFEQDLRAALRHREPPPGFAERVVSRLPERRGYPRWLALAAALLIAIAGMSIWQVRERQQRMAAEKAKAELIYALQVTSHGLQTARTMLVRQAQGKRL